MENINFNPNGIEFVSSSASEIDKNIELKNNTQNLALISKLKSCNRVDMVGDSIFYGVQVSKIENLFARNIKKIFKDNLAISNQGFITSNDSGVFTKEHINEYTNKNNWTSNYLNHKSINGFTYDCSTINETISFISMDNDQTSFKIGYVKSLVNSTYEVYVNSVLKTTINSVADGTSTYIESDSILLGGSGNTIMIKLISGSISISGIRYTDGTTKEFNNYATGGRRAVYVKDAVLEYHKSADCILWNLGYNDIQGGSSAEQKNEAETYIAGIAQHFKDNNKLFIYVNTVWDITLQNNWVYQKMVQVFGSYEHFYFLDFRGTIQNNLGEIADTTYRKNILKEWGDDAHPNDLGSERMFRYVCLKIFNEYNKQDELVISHKNNSLVSQYSWLKGIANYCVVLGESNTVEKPNSLVFGTFGKSNNANITFAQSWSNTYIRQHDISIRSATTTTNIEQFLRDSSVSALMYSNPNTINILKGVIIAHDTTANTWKEIEVDAVIVNTNGVNTLVADTGYPVNGVVDKKGILVVSAKVYGGTSNSYSIRVVGLNTQIEWISKIEITQISKV